jgi:hypothetical protein
MLSSGTKRKLGEVPSTKPQPLVSADKVSLAISTAKEQIVRSKGEPNSGFEPPPKKQAPNEIIIVKPTSKATGSGGAQKSLYSVAANLSSLKSASWKPPAPQSSKKPKPPTPAPKPLSPPNPECSFIDEVINEADDLLQAAREAQSLGRLRSASSYLLLAHARLVGLGRRFDRSRCLEDEMLPNPEGKNGGDSNSTTVILPPMPVAQNALSDVSLMEHLARSAMELHHKRTGRGMQHDAQMEKQANNLVPIKKAERPKEEEDETPTKRKGGRGKKPPTLVMHTLLGAELDAKKLMKIHPE